MPVDYLVRGFKPFSFYIALLLKAIRDRSVFDWDSLTRFQKYYGLRFIQWGSSMVGEAPAVVDLLDALERAGLVRTTGINLRRDVWVRRDNFSPAPAGKVVYDSHGDDPNHLLDGPSPLSTDALRIAISPHWQSIQDVLGISLSALAELQNPRAMVVVPEIFPEPRQTQKYADVFVVMPFTVELQNVFDDHIRPVCKRLSMSTSRADDFFNAEAIMADVWGAIKNAKVIVADCTGRNPNVFYEMGIAHTLGKKVVLLYQTADDFPFDVSHIQRISYEYTAHGMKKFEEALGSALTSSLQNS